MKTSDSSTVSRRRFITETGALLGTSVLLGPASVSAAERMAETEEVTPTEDLMQEHGVLRRLLLIYEAMAGRLQKSREAPLHVLKEATDLVRRFVEDYHEKDEEEFLFPRFETAGKMVDLVKVLYAQHRAGRQLTTRLQALLAADQMSKPEVRQQVVSYLEAFIRMYRPHAAREDTVLYPAFRSVISPKNFMALGEAFEDKEEKLFGKDGFEKIVAQVAGLEKKLGIYQLAQFTPKV